MFENQGLAGLLSALQPRPEAEAPAIDIDALCAAAFADGLADGRGMVEAELLPLRGQVGAAVAAFEAACQVDVTALRPLVSELVRQLAEAVLLAELGRGAAVLMPLVEAGLAAVRPGAAATLHGHPATLTAIAAVLADVAVLADESLGLDEFRVSGADFIVDVSLRSRLNEIIGEMQ